MASNVASLLSIRFVGFPMIDPAKLYSQENGYRPVTVRPGAILMLNGQPFALMNPPKSDPSRPSTFFASIITAFECTPEQGPTIYVEETIQIPASGWMVVYRESGEEIEVLRFSPIIGG